MKNTCPNCKKKLTCAHCVGRRGGQVKGRKGFAVTGNAREAAKKRWALWKTVTGQPLVGKVVGGK